MEGTAAPSGLSLPLLVEQYVDHGSCLFKVYVLGEEAVMVTRPTLNLETEEKIENSTPHVEVMSRVSAYPQSRSWGKYDLAPPGHGVPAPPEWFWREIETRRNSGTGRPTRSVRRSGDRGGGDDRAGQN